MNVVITKQNSTLCVYDEDNLVLTIPVVLGKNPADKEKEGDLATPEGEFYICYQNPASQYHRFLGISYPNAEDANRGLRDGLITAEEADQIRSAITARKQPPWHTALGGEIGLHGPGPNRTWTHGCIAMATDHIEQLFGLLKPSDPVTIRP